MPALGGDFQMNPLKWKREHQIALACAAALGAVIGAIFGFWYLIPAHHFYWCLAPSSSPRCDALEVGYYLLVLFWIVLAD